MTESVWLSHLTIDGSSATRDTQHWISLVIVKVRLIIKWPGRRQSQPRADHGEPARGEPARMIPPSVEWPLPLDGIAARKPAGPSAWTVQTDNLAVECSHKLLRTLAPDAMLGFETSPAGGTEIGGVLYGSRTGSSVRIESYRPLACEHLHGPDFELSDHDERELEKLLADPVSSLTPVGWYFSQYQSLWLTPRAIALHERHFHEPWQVVLVLGRSRLQPLRIGLFVGNLDGSLSPVPEGELTMGTDWRIGPCREIGTHAVAAPLRRIK